MKMKLVKSVALNKVGIILCSLMILGNISAMASSSGSSEQVINKQHSDVKSAAKEQKVVESADEILSAEFLLYLSEIEVIKGDMVDPMTMATGLAKNSREKTKPNVVGVKDENDEEVDDE